MCIHLNLVYQSCFSHNNCFINEYFTRKNVNIGVATGGPYWAMALPKISVMGMAVVIN